MKKVILTLILSAQSTTGIAMGPEGLSVSERYSYAMGVRLGQLLRGQGIERLDSRAFAAAIDDVLAGRALRLSEQDMQAAVQAQRQIFAQQRAQRAADALAAGREFLTRNAAQADVVVLPSGLQYRVLASGNGERPGAGDSVRVHYQGSRLDGSVFDSSVERGQPAELSLLGVIPGFREALTRMRTGDHWQVFVPSGLAYGEHGAGTEIGPNETLVFELQLLDIIR